jgi:tetratricopeptide (TPR) repeat protein
MPLRQHSLRAVFDYSWELLGPEERAVFARLSVFRGGFTRSAAEQVAGASLRTLAALTNKSLISREPHSGRYRVHELVRQYAEGRLGMQPAEVERVAGSHAQFFASFLNERGPSFKGLESQTVAAEIEIELDKVRAAWSWLLRTGAVDLASTALGALELFYTYRSAFPEAEEVFKATVSSFEAPEPEAGSQRAWLLARALVAQAGASEARWRHREVLALSSRALALIDEQHHPLEVAHALLIGAIAAFWSDNRERGVEAGERALRLYRQVGDGWETAKALATIGSCFGWLGAARSEAYLRESIELQRSLPGGALSIPESLAVLGDVLSEQGKYEDGCRQMRAALALLERRGDSFSKVDCLLRLSNAERKRGDYVVAEVRIRQALALVAEKFPFAEPWAHTLLTDVLKERGRLDEAATVAGAVLSADHPLSATTARLALGDIACLRGEHAAGVALLTQSLAEYERLGVNWGIVVACDYLGHQACAEGRHADAYVLFLRALQTALSFRLMPIAVHVVAGLARLKVLLGQPERALELLTLVERQPITEHQTRKRRVEPLRAELASRLSADAFAAAVERGNGLELEAVLTELSAR